MRVVLGRVEAAARFERNLPDDAVSLFEVLAEIAARFERNLWHIGQFCKRVLAAVVDILE